MVDGRSDEGRRVQPHFNGVYTADNGRARAEEGERIMDDTTARLASLLQKIDGDGGTVASGSQWPVLMFVLIMTKH